MHWRRNISLDSGLVLRGQSQAFALYQATDNFIHFLFVLRNLQLKRTPWLHLPYFLLEVLMYIATKFVVTFTYHVSTKCTVLQAGRLELHSIE